MREDKVKSLSSMRASTRRLAAVLGGAALVLGVAALVPAAASVSSAAGPASPAGVQHKWVASWAASPMSGSTSFSDQTVRNIIYTSAGGNSLRVQVSNTFGSAPLSVGAVSVGVVLDGALYCTQAAIGSMIANRYGRILFFTGEGAFTGGSGRAHVSAAKMGLVGLARALASEFATQNIRANVVSPGSIDTRRDNPEWYQGRVPSAAGIPLGRQGHVDEIAATCLFLVSDDGGFITGQTIHVNGGTGYY